MKTLFIIFTFFIVCGAQAQLTAIPDSNFEQALLDLGIDSDGQLNGEVLTADIVNVETLDLSGRYLQNLIGLEDFESLRILDISYTYLDNGTNPNILDLTSLDNLEELYMDGDLDNIVIYVNILDVSSNPNLKIIQARGNWELMTINLEGSDLNIDSLNLDFDQSFVCIQVTNPMDAENGQGLYTNWILCCDGDYSFSEDCSLSTTEFLTESISVFPNPVVEFAFIESPYQLKTVEIYTLNGEKVQSDFLEANRIDMRSLASGIYFIKLSGENGSQVVKKIVKK